jgi:hypothetical protein
MMAITDAQIRGYLLEEALAWLMRNSGYDLLVHEQQDLDELVSKGSELRVRGRGTTHQVDVLGEFAFTPAFSLPVRLFLEAKHYGKRCGIDVVRNAHGVLSDVNQNYVAHAGGRPRRRFQYCYALFSASGFSPEAEAFAIAHQISLVDLSAPAFSWLLSAVETCASELRKAAVDAELKSFPVRDARVVLRDLLGTSLGLFPVEHLQLESGLVGHLNDFARKLQLHSQVDLLIGFPPAPFILPMVVDDREAFTRHAVRHPTHHVALHRRGKHVDADWVAAGGHGPNMYQLTFSLPRGIEEWITDNEGRRRTRAREIKTDFLATITIYFQHDNELRVCHLRYEPEALRHYGRPPEAFDEVW